MDDGGHSGKWRWQAANSGGIFHLIKKKKIL
jgi:hypothetical protein